MTEPAVTLWDQVAFSAVNVISESELDEFDKDLLISIVLSAGGAVDDIYQAHHDYFAAFGPFDFERAVPMVEVLAAAMTCRFTRQLFDQGFQGHAELWGRLTRVVLDLFENFTEERAAECLSMDQQFNDGRDRIGNSENAIPWAVEQHLLIALVARAAGGSFQWPVTNDWCPAGSTWDLYGAGFVPPEHLDTLNFDRMVTVNASLLASEAGMYACFEALREQRDGA